LFFPNALCQQDNARTHIARVSLEYLEHAIIIHYPFVLAATFTGFVTHQTRVDYNRTKIEKSSSSSTVYTAITSFKLHRMSQEEIDYLIRSLASEWVAINGKTVEFHVLLLQLNSI
jgi:hypothetical protein